MGYVIKATVKKNGEVHEVFDRQYSGKHIAGAMAAIDRAEKLRSNPNICKVTITSRCNNKLK